MSVSVSASPYGTPQRTSTAVPAAHQRDGEGRQHAKCGDEPELRQTEIVRGPNIKPFPEFDPLPESLAAQVAIKVDDGNNARAAEVTMAALIETFVTLDERAFNRRRSVVPRLQQ